MPTSMPIYFDFKAFNNSLSNILKLKTPLKVGYTHFGIVHGKENVKYMFEEQQSFIKEFRAKVIELHEENPETKYIFNNLISYFTGRSDIVGENDLALKNIILGIVYGMMLDLGFRKLDDEELEILKRFRD